MRNYSLVLTNVFNYVISNVYHHLVTLSHVYRHLVVTSLHRMLDCMEEPIIDTMVCGLTMVYSDRDGRIGRFDDSHLTVDFTLG